VRRLPRDPLEVKQAPQAPLPRKTLERHEPLPRSDISPRMDIGVRRLPRDPLEVKQAPLAPLPRKTLERSEPLALDNVYLLKGHKREKVAPRPALKQGRHHKHPCHAVLLTSASRAGSPRPLDGRKRERRVCPGAAPHGLTDQRFEA
jgi:hypothetical protein